MSIYSSAAIFFHLVLFDHLYFESFVDHNLYLQCKEENIEQCIVVRTIF